MQRIARFIGLAAVVGAIAVPASAQAYNCHSWKCVNKALNKMQKQVTFDNRAVGVLLNCIAEVPFTSYGDPKGTFGYAYSKDGTTNHYTTALDLTFSGDAVGAWMLADSCNSKKTAIARAHVGRQPAGLGAFGPEMKFSLGAVNR